MDFALTEQQQMIRKEVATLARSFSLDYWLEKDRKHEYPRDFVKAFARAGWLGAVGPAGYGAPGAGRTRGATPLTAASRARPRHAGPPPLPRQQRDLHRLPRDSRGQRRRRGGQWLLSHPGLAQPRARADGDRGRRHRPRRPRPRGRVRQAARRLRPAHRPEPGDRASAGDGVGQAGGRGGDVPEGRMAVRPRSAVRRGVECRQAARRRGGLRGVRRRAADARRLRLRQGVLRRAALARGAAVQDRAGLPADGTQPPRGARTGPAEELLTVAPFSTIRLAVVDGELDEVVVGIAEVHARR